MSIGSIGMGRAVREGGGGEFLKTGSREISVVLGRWAFIIMTHHQYVFINADVLPWQQLIFMLTVNRSFSNMAAQLFSTRPAPPGPLNMFVSVCKWQEAPDSDHAGALYCSPDCSPSAFPSRTAPKHPKCNLLFLWLTTFCLSSFAPLSAPALPVA